ncbi:MAG: DUF4129 domain-containing protein [Spirochaetales bacterium]|nr:DUF4129 domain-containing protein [Spirochaetales bacterium]
MRRSRAVFIEWSLMLSLVVSMYAAYGFLESRGQVISLPLAILSAILTIVIIADNVLISRRCPVNIYVLANALFSFSAAFSAQRFAVLAQESTVSRAIIASIAAIICFVCAFIVEKEVQNSMLIVNFDVIIIIQAILIYIVGKGSNSLSVALMNFGFAACSAALGALLVSRMGGSDKAWSLLGILAIGVLPVSIIAFSVFSSESLRTASYGIVSFVAIIARAIYGFFARLFGTLARWLESLLGWNIRYDFEVPPYSQRVSSNVVREYGNLSWLPFVISFAVLVGIAVFIFRMKGRRMEAKGRRQRRRNVQRAWLGKGRRTSGKGGLSGRIRFILAYLRNYDSLGARYIRTERRLKREGFPRNQGETAHSFLRRVADRKGDEQMFLMANEIEQMFYSRKLYQQDKTVAE